MSILVNQLLQSQCLAEGRRESQRVACVRPKATTQHRVNTALAAFKGSTTQKNSPCTAVGYELHPALTFALRRRIKGP